MAKEAGHFEFKDIVVGLNDKLIRRHPHVFGDETIATAEAMTERWESDKAKERAAKTSRGRPQRPARPTVWTSALPALTHCQKIVQRATRVGFDWEKPTDVLPKLDEEIKELAAEMPSGAPDRITDELGDVLFTTVCLAHKLRIDPETALRQANRKFERRFRAMESRLGKEKRQNDPISLNEWENAWRAVKSKNSI